MSYTGKISSFTDLNAWKESHALVLAVYSVTKSFPKEEIFVLTSQLRRSVISITSNIAEGFSRQSKKEKLQFYFIAKGSLTESQNQLILARDLNYIDTDTYANLDKQAIEVSKLLFGLIRSIRSK